MVVQRVSVRDMFQVGTPSCHMIYCGQAVMLMLICGGLMKLTARLWIVKVYWTGPSQLVGPYGSSPGGAGHAWQRGWFVQFRWRGGEHVVSQNGRAGGIRVWGRDPWHWQWCKQDIWDGNSNVDVNPSNGSDTAMTPCVNSILSVTVNPSVNSNVRGPLPPTLAVM